MPRALVRPKAEAAARGRGYQLTPPFPRLPGIIPERFHERPPLAGSPPRGALCSLKEPCGHYLRFPIFAQGGRSKNILTVNNL